MRDLLLSERQLDLVLLARTGLRGPNPIRAYRESLERDLADLLSVLPSPCREILDIGCGMAGIDLLLCRHLRGPEAPEQPAPAEPPCPFCGGLHVHLLDVWRVDEDPVYGYHTSAETGCYADFHETDEFLQVNGMDPVATHYHAGNKGEFPYTRPLDLVLSLISCGFHFPVVTYLPRIVQALRPGGVCVLDVRRGTDQEAELEAAFAHLAVLREEEKYRRIACWPTELGPEGL